MTQWVDFKTIKETVSMEQVLEHYGLMTKLTKKGTELVGPCPIHDGKNPTQFHASLTKNNFNCFGDCHGGGNLIDFVRKMEGIDSGNLQHDTRQAALLIQDWFGLAQTKPQATARTKATPPASVTRAAPRAAAPDTAEPRVNAPLPFGFKHLDHAHPYLQERGFSPEIIEAFGVGYHGGRGIMQGRVVIPIHNEQGELVAYAGRWPGEPPEGEGKYKLPAGFHKSMVVFNLHRAKASAHDQGLILVEGFFDVMRLAQAGLQNAVALMGSVLSKDQAQLIADAVGPQGKITLLFDGDEAGRKGRDEALERLSRKVAVKVIDLADGMQPDRLTVDEMQQFAC